MKKLVLLSALLAISTANADTDHKMEMKTKLHDCLIQQPLPEKNMTGAYLKIEHFGPTVKIASVEIPEVPAKVELHTMEMKGDIMEMKPLEALDVSEGVRIFRKGGDHIMLMEIAEDKKPQAGEKYQLNIKFSNGEQASCAAEVKKAEEIMELMKQQKKNHHEKSEKSENSKHKHHH